MNKGVFNMLGKKLNAASTIKAWAVVICDGKSTVEEAGYWVRDLRDACRELGRSFLQSIDNPVLIDVRQA